MLVYALLFRELEKRGHGHSIEVIEAAAAGANGAINALDTFIEWALGAVYSLDPVNPVGSFDGWSRGGCGGNCRCGWRWTRKTNG
jgi:hypothetical protein